LPAIATTDAAAFAGSVKLDNSFKAKDAMTIWGKMLSFVAFMAAITPAVDAADADQAWPDRTVRIITGSAGGPPDAAARTLADDFAKRWKKSVIVENRPGADFIIAVRGLLEAQDGHTLLLAPLSVLTVNPLLHGTLPYDPERDFAPISIAVEDFLCVAAAPSLGVNSLSELVKLAATKPGELNAYAVPAAASAASASGRNDCHPLAELPQLPFGSNIEGPHPPLPSGRSPTTRCLSTTHRASS
jgi:hypothetical protein